jgi:hypothetical protein
MTSRIDGDRHDRIARLSLAILLPTMILAAPAAAQVSEEEAAARALRAQIVRCFLPPEGAQTPARIGFELGPDGTLAGTPEIMTGGSSEIDVAFARAAQRAVERCAPYDPAVEGRVEVNFALPLTASASAPVEPPAPELSGQASAGAPNPYDAPDGFCFIDPDRSAYEERLWTSLQPPAGRNEEVETVAMDCDHLRRTFDGDTSQPMAAAIVARTAEPDGMSETLDEFLDRLGARLEADEPMTERFWQSPPVAGTPYLGRDDNAVYTAGRFLAPDGSITTTVVSAYTRVGGQTRTFILARYAGEDISPASRDELARTVARAHALEASAPAGKDQDSKAKLP